MGTEQDSVGVPKESDFAGLTQILRYPPARRSAVEENVSRDTSNRLRIAEAVPTNAIWLDNNRDARRRFCGSFGAPGPITDGPTQDLWLAPYWFWGAIVGGILAISVQIIFRLFRGQFRARLSRLWLVEVAAACLIIRRLGQNWRAQTRFDLHHARFARWVESRARGMQADAADLTAPSSERLAWGSAAVIFVGTAVGVVGALVVIAELFVFLANLELCLPQRVRDSIALAMVGALLLIVAVVACCLTFAAHRR